MGSVDIIGLAWFRNHSLKGARTYVETFCKVVYLYVQISIDIPLFLIRRLLIFKDPPQKGSDRLRSPP